jgi:hypothetical protein
MKINNPIRWLRAKVRQVLNIADPALADHIDEAIMITTAVKRLIDLPAENSIVSITPAGMDYRIAEQLNKTLDEVIINLRLYDTRDELLHYHQRLRGFVCELRKANPALRGAIYLKVASLFLHKRLMGDLPLCTCDTLVQVKYWENKNG